MEAEAAGEEPVAVRVVEHHPGLRAGHGERARVDLGEELDVSTRVADDCRSPGRSRGAVNAGDLGLRHSEEAERVVVTQICLARERKPCQIVERPHRGWIDSELVEPPPVEGDPFVHVARELLQPSRLEGPQLRPRHRLRCRVVDHGGHPYTPAARMGQRSSDVAGEAGRRGRRPRRPVWIRSELSPGCRAGRESRCRTRRRGPPAARNRGARWPAEGSRGPQQARRRRA